MFGAVEMLSEGHATCDGVSVSMYVEGQFDDAEEDTNSGEITLVNTADLLTARITSGGAATVEKRYKSDCDSISEEDYDYDDDDDYDYYDENTKDLTKTCQAAKSGSGQNRLTRAPNQQNKSTKISSYQPSDKLFKNMLHKINVERFEGLNLHGSAVNRLTENDRKSKFEKVRTKDKLDRATVEQVLDPRTRMILFKLLDRHFLKEINGCVSTGKEANVYHATGKNEEDFAIKIYKTSILTFKDRDKYVTGEFRFRHGYCRHNPRKMVRTWAEKEMRNLSRIHSEGLCCPRPVMLRSHVLLMSFVGKDGIPAPKLKEVELSEGKARELYLSCIVMMRRLFQNCKLVHADLSEFNILYDEGKLCLIDVSQSVEHDHPHALEFLRKDCLNMTEYFRRNGVCTMTVKELFDFITDPNITDSNMDSYLEKMQDVISNRNETERSEQEKIDEEVFKQIFIPHRLHDVVHYEQDSRKAVVGQSSELPYTTITGLKPDLSGPTLEPVLLNDVDKTVGGSENDKGDSSGQEETQSSNDSSEDEDDETDDGKRKGATAARPRDESPNSKKERKKEVKEAQREKRKTKIKKHVKKRKEKLLKQRKK